MTQYAEFSAEYDQLARNAAYQIIAVTDLEYDDAYQSAYLWLLENPGAVERRRSGDTLYGKQIQADIRRAVMAQSASDRPKSGWDNDRVRVVLEYVWDSEQPQAPAEEIRAKTDPSHGLTWLAVKMDVKQALEALSVYERRILFRKYFQGDTWAVIAADEGSSDASVRKDAQRAIEAVVRELNAGERQPGSDGIGSRRVVSNAQARAMLEEAS